MNITTGDLVSKYWEDHPETREKYSDFLGILGDYGLHSKEALDYLKERTTNEPQNPQYWDMLFEYYVLDKNFKKVHKILNKMTQMFPTAIRSLKEWSKSIDRYKDRIMVMEIKQRYTSISDVLNHLK